MCRVELFICRAHGKVRGFQLRRCPAAVGASGLPAESEVCLVREMPVLDAEEGCDAPPVLHHWVQFFVTCPDFGKDWGELPRPACHRTY